MALTYTPEVEIGAPLPKFELPMVNGEPFSSQNIESASAKLILFICAHCPYVQAIEERLVQLGSALKEQNIPMVAICSNDSTDYPEDRPDQLLIRSQKMNYSFPYLVDETQKVAQSFGAVCTPDFFVYDRDNRLAYRGRLDDSWKDPTKVTREELKNAILKIAKGEKITEESVPAMGCSIKWLSPQGELQ